MVLSKKDLKLRKDTLGIPGMESQSSQEDYDTPRGKKTNPLMPIEQVLMLELIDEVKAVRKLLTEKL